MNMLNLLKSRVGKSSLSLLKAVGLSAAVGLGGVGAWMYLDSSGDTNANTAFNIAQPVPEEVVYVAGAGPGHEYGEGGQVRSSISATTSKTFELQQRDAALAAARKRDARGPSYQGSYDDDPSVDLKAYQMGGSEGLGTGENETAEYILKSQKAMADAQAQLAGLTQATTQAGQQAQQAQQATAAQQAALASASRDWGKRPQDMAKAGGNAITTTYAAGMGGGTGEETGGQGRISSSRAMQQLQNLKGYENKAGSRFGPGEREGEIIGGSVTSREGRELDFVRKRSADIAANKDRAANEGSRAFLASARDSGGIQLVNDDANVSTGTSASSEDFDNPTMGRLSGLNSAIADQELTELERDRDRKSVKKWMIISLVSVVATAGLSLGAALSFIPINKLDTYAKRFEAKYPDSVPGRKGREMVNILRRIVWLSMIPIIGFVLATIQLLRKIGTIRKIWKDWFGKKGLPSKADKQQAEADVDNED